MKDVLIVVDMQNDFIDGALGTKEAEAIVAPLAERIARHTGDIYFTRDTHGEDYLLTNEGKRTDWDSVWKTNVKALEHIRVEYIDPGAIELTTIPA